MAPRGMANMYVRCSRSSPFLHKVHAPFRGMCATMKMCIHMLAKGNRSFVKSISSPPALVH